MDIPEDFTGYRTPDQLLTELREAKRRLLTYGNEYATFRRDRTKAELAYERAKTKALVSIVVEAKGKSERPPAEDIRKALAHDAVDDALWEEYLMRLADVEVYDKLIKVESTNISAIQSELQQLRTEFQHA